MHRQTVTLQNPRNPTTHPELEAFGNPARTEHKNRRTSQPETRETIHNRATQAGWIRRAAESHVGERAKIKQHEPG
jgi:hypothetical protein